MSVSVKKPIFKRWWFWIICVVVVAGAIGGISGGSKGIQFLDLHGESFILLKPGETYHDNITVQPSDYEAASISVVSENPSVATIELDHTGNLSYIVTAHEEGEAIIYVIADNGTKSNEIKISVMESVFK